MIVDSVEHRGIYGCLSDRIARGLEFLAGQAGSEFAEKEIEIDGRNIFAMFQTYTTEGEEGRLYEAHRSYVDIQYIVSGHEVIRVADVSRLQEATAYDETKDVAFFTVAAGTDVRLAAGDFAILYPHDAHLPKLPVGSPSPVEKVVVKVRIA